MIRFADNTLLGLLALLATFAMSLPAHANKYDDSPLKSIQIMVDAGIYDEANEKLDAMLKQDPDDADVLSLLGYSHRKQERYDEALGFYQRALDIDPEHKAANEYLGQLYLETNQLTKAEERLAVLDDVCWLPCREYTSLKQAIDTYQQ